MRAESFAFHFENLKRESSSNEFVNSLKLKYKTFFEWDRNGVSMWCVFRVETRKQWAMHLKLILAWDARHSINGARQSQMNNQPESNLKVCAKSCNKCGCMQGSVERNRSRRPRGACRQWRSPARAPTPSLRPQRQALQLLRLPCPVCSWRPSCLQAEERRLSGEHSFGTSLSAVSQCVRR